MPLWACGTLDGLHIVNCQRILLVLSTGQGGCVRMIKKLKNCLVLGLSLSLLLTTGVFGSAAAESEADNNTEAAEAVETAQMGSPWIDSIITGNLPGEAPDVKDDLYLHYNYDELMANQGQMYNMLLTNQSIIADYAASAIEEGSLKASDGNCTDAELEQLQIFYQQASDLEALEAAGISQLQPYLDKINGAATLEDLNSILVSEDFPFSPYLYLMVGAYDMDEQNNVFVYPEFLFVDNVEGAVYYQETDDPVEQTAHQQAISQTGLMVMQDLALLGLQQEEIQPCMMSLIQFEQSYGKDAAATSVFLDMEYGAYGTSTENMSLDELAALCPNYPVKESVEKFGKEKSPFYSVISKKWMESFNSLWTEENLELLKTLTMVKIIRECSPYLNPAIYDPARAMTGQPPMDAKSFAAAACNQNNTFAHLLGKIYVADQYTDEDIACLTTLADDLSDVFTKLVEKTTWLSDGSKEKMCLKLDKMRKNILVPDGGYVDFSDLSLTPTEDGGTLLGNYLTIKAYMNDKINARIGQDSLARMSWEHFTPATVNCFYDPDSNSINILPGFTAAGMYRDDMTKEELLGGIGWVISHEISHGFDFCGSQYDANGTGNSIFAEEDMDKYLEKVEQLVAYYDTIEPLPGVPVKGNAVKVEAAADLIGLQLVMGAAEENEGTDYEALFQQTAEIYCTVFPSPDFITFLIGGDSHPLNYLRTNVNVQMFDELYDTYGIEDGDGMYLPEESRVRFWGK